MKKKEMVQAILERGLLISPDLLDRLNEGTLRSILQNGGEGGLVLAEAPATMPEKPAHTTNAQPPRTGEAAPAVKGVSIKIREIKQKQTVSTEDFVEYYNNKYNAIKDMLLRRTAATSINKIKEGTPATIIGMVKEKTSQGLMLEDPTGEIEVVSPPSTESASEDDVVAVTGYARQGKFFGKDIIFPDVPLTNPVKTIEASLFISESPPSPRALADADIVCTPDNITANSAGSLEIPNPAWINISIRGKEMALLVYRPDGGAGIAGAIELLKKRHLSPERKKILGSEDPFLIDPIPDVFWLVSGEKGVRTYKGVTVISCGQNSPARLDLATRKADFLAYNLTNKA